MTHRQPPLNRVGIKSQACRSDCEQRFAARTQ